MSIEKAPKTGKSKAEQNSAKKELAEYQARTRRIKTPPVSDSEMAAFEALKQKKQQEEQQDADEAVTTIRQRIGVEPQTEENSDAAYQLKRAKKYESDLTTWQQQERVKGPNDAEIDAAFENLQNVDSPEARRAKEDLAKWQKEQMEERQKEKRRAKKIEEDLTKWQRRENYQALRAKQTEEDLNAWQRQQRGEADPEFTVGRAELTREEMAAVRAELAKERGTRSASSQPEKLQLDKDAGIAQIQLRLNEALQADQKIKQAIASLPKPDLKNEIGHIAKSFFSSLRKGQFPTSSPETLAYQKQMQDLLKEKERIEAEINKTMEDLTYAKYESMKAVAATRPGGYKMPISHEGRLEREAQAREGRVAAEEMFGSNVGITEAQAEKQYGVAEDAGDVQIFSREEINRRLRHPEVAATGRIRGGDKKSSRARTTQEIASKVAFDEEAEKNPLPNETILDIGEEFRTHQRKGREGELTTEQLQARVEMERQKNDFYEREAILPSEPKIFRSNLEKNLKKQLADFEKQYYANPRSIAERQEGSSESPILPEAPDLWETFYKAFNKKGGVNKQSTSDAAKDLVINLALLNKAREMKATGLDTTYIERAKAIASFYQLDLTKENDDAREALENFGIMLPVPEETEPVTAKMPRVTQAESPKGKKPKFDPKKRVTEAPITRPDSMRYMNKIEIDSAQLEARDGKFDKLAYLLGRDVKELQMLHDEIAGDYRKAFEAPIDTRIAAIKAVNEQAGAMLDDAFPDANVDLKAAARLSIVNHAEDVVQNEFANRRDTLPPEDASRATIPNTIGEQRDTLVGDSDTENTVVTQRNSSIRRKKNKSSAA
jgi:hypothetical protein